MPYNGSGVYVATSLPGSFNPATTSSNATPADWNTLLADISTALSTVICKDGQSTISADIPMATHKITGLGNATVGTDALNQQGALYVYNQQTVATVTFVDVTNIPTTVNNLMLCFDFLVSTGCDLYLQFYNSVGALDSTAVYSYLNYGASTSSSAVLSTAAGPTTQITVANLINQSTLIGVNGTFSILDIQGTKETQLTGNTTYQNTGGGGPRVLLTTGGARTVAGPITGIRVAPTAGTITGKLTLYASV